MTNQALNDYKNLSNNEFSTGVENVDFRQIFGSLRRRWKWVFAGVIFGSVWGVTKVWDLPDIYKGEFLIVMRKSDQQIGSAGQFSTGVLSKLAGMSSGGGADESNTEILILKSPSVLEPVFEVAKSMKSPEVAEGMTVQGWSRSVEVEKSEGTSVLIVSYLDQNKDHILPLSRLLSQTYQDYSNRSRNRELNNLISYLEEQISIMKPQAASSTAAAISYGFKHGLSLKDGMPIAGEVSGGGMPGEQMAGASRSIITSARIVGGSIENERSRLLQKVKSIELILKEINKDEEGAIYTSSKIFPLTQKESSFEELSRIDRELSAKLARFKENDPVIQRLRRERGAMIEFIKNETISLLRGELVMARAELEANDFPRGVINRHRDLTQKALRDESTLVTLRNQLSQFRLERARDATPWELISEPRVFNQPVAPRRSQMLAKNIFIGLIFGIAIALLIDLRTGRIFKREELENKIPFELLQRLPAQYPETWGTSIRLLVDGPLAKTGNGSVALIPVGDIPSDQLKSFETELRLALGKNRELIVSRDLLITRASSSQLLITSLGATKNHQLAILKAQLALQGNPIQGWVLLDSKLEP